MTEPMYSPWQEQGHTDVGMTGAEMPSPAMPATPDVAGAVGPPVQSSDPWPGRSAATYAAEASSAESYGAILAQAQQSPGTVVTSEATTGKTNH